jgi:transcriptional regulator with XRE-family HTH domain
MHATISSHASTEDKGSVHTLIGARIRQLRGEKELSQGDIERRTGLLRGYVSRVEHGGIVPSLDTLERFASALEVPFYCLFYEGGEPPTPLPRGGLPLDDLVDMKETTGTHTRFLRKLRYACRPMADSDRKFMLLMAKKLVDRYEALVERKRVIDLQMETSHTVPRLDSDLSRIAAVASTPKSISTVKETSGESRTSADFGSSAPSSDRRPRRSTQVAIGWSN